jgi:Holliday junction DNA helicase RuvA
MTLFGFATSSDRDLFRLLISVSGIGPKIAQALLSGLDSEDLRLRIGRGEVESLTAIPGVGRKTAERIVLELREKVVRSTGESAAASSPGPTPSDVRNEAFLALTSLGYSRPVAEKAIRAALAEAGGTSLSVEELIRFALKHAG